jgi:cation transport regulator ChaC
MPSQIDLQPGDVGLFGYGSLLLLSSMERTLGRPYTGRRYPCHVQGWRRTWTSTYPNGRYSFVDESGAKCTPKNMLYLNVHPAGAAVNGVVYIIREDELAGYDKREEEYYRVDVQSSLTDLVVNGPVWMYVSLPEFTLTQPVGRETAAIRRAYVEIVEAGLDELGPEFRTEYLASTDPLPEQNVVDDVWEEPRQALFDA